MFYVVTLDQSYMHSQVPGGSYESIQDSIPVGGVSAGLGHVLEKNEGTFATNSLGKRSQSIHGWLQSTIILSAAAVTILIIYSQITNT